MFVILSTSIEYVLQQQKDLKKYDNLGIPKTIYSDQGSEFKKASFQKLLDKRNIDIIFPLEHAAFVESSNKTVKNETLS